MATKKAAGKEKGARRSNQSESRRLAGLANAKVDVPNVGEVLLLQAKAANVVTHLGGPTNVAKLLNVAKSQPRRWLRGS